MQQSYDKNQTRDLMGFLAARFLNNNEQLTEEQKELISSFRDASRDVLLALRPVSVDFTSPLIRIALQDIGGTSTPEPGSIDLLPSTPGQSAGGAIYASSAVCVTGKGYEQAPHIGNLVGGQPVGRPPHGGIQVTK